MFNISEKLRSRDYHKTEFRTPESGGLLGLWMAYWKVHDPKVLETGVTDTCTMNKLAFKVGWHWFTSHAIKDTSFTPLMLTLWALILSPIVWLFWVAPDVMAQLATLVIFLTGVGFLINAAYDAAPKRFLDIVNILFCWFLAPAETVILAINMIMEADRRRFIRTPFQNCQLK